MAPTYPDLKRCHKPSDVPSYAEHLHCCPLYKGETPKPFEFPTDLPMRTRLPAHSVGGEYIKKYALAVEQMKNLPTEDPRNFIQHANVHFAYCNGAYYMGNTTKPFKAHDGWFFLPWHRWYLYFYERILAKLLGDDSFALPFWNWDLEDGMIIPPMYADHCSPLYDKKRNPAHLDAFVDLGFSRGQDPALLTRKNLIWRNYMIMFKQIVVLGACTRAFHGEKIKEDSPKCTCGAETLEHKPHDTLHNWTGTVPTVDKTFYGEDIGIFYTAAQDLIFFAHHANVDRLWTIWKTLPGRKDYDDPDLLDTKFYFYDENACLVEVRAGNAFDPEKLRYTYEYSPTPWLMRPTPWVMENIASAALALPAGFVVQTLDLQVSPTFSRPMKIVVSREPMDIGFAGEPPSSRTFIELLVIEGIRVQRNIAVKFDVFVQLDDLLAATPYVDTMPPQYVGTYVELPRGDVEAGCGQSSMRTVISEVLRDLGVGQKEKSIVVTFIPKVNLQQPIQISTVKIEREWS